MKSPRYKSISAPSGWVQCCGLFTNAKQQNLKTINKQSFNQPFKMASRFFSFVLFFIFCAFTYAQETVNLVPNPSFEEFENGCPINLNELPIGWSKWRSSPNSFSTCVEPQNLVDSLGGSPWTGFGTQWPADGESFCGFSAFSPSPSMDFPQPNFREYLGCELTEPLEIGTTYFVSFKVSTGFKGYYWVTWATSHIGAIFTSQSYDWYQNPMPIPNFAHVYTEEIISDTVNWIIISGTIVADQPYTHMALGVFFEYASLNTVQMLDGSNLGSYYFVDDVCVSPYPDCINVVNSVTQMIDNNLSIYPNPASDYIRIEFNQPIIGCKLYDNSGRLVKSWNSIEEIHNLMLTNFPIGIYTLVVNTKDNRILREKLLIVR